VLHCRIGDKITKFSFKCRAKTTTHPKELASTLPEEEELRRLKRFKTVDLTSRIWRSADRAVS